MSWEEWFSVPATDSHITCYVAYVFVNLDLCTSNHRNSPLLQQENQTLGVLTDYKTLKTTPWTNWARIGLLSNRERQHVQPCAHIWCRVTCNMLPSVMIHTCSPHIHRLQTPNLKFASKHAHISHTFKHNFPALLQWTGFLCTQCA